MSSFFEAISVSQLLFSALLAGLAASVVGGIIGSYVVVKRIAFISGSISHSVLAGIGLFLYLQRAHGISWLSPLTGALGAAVLSAWLIGWMHLNYRQREDSVISAVWSIGMAIGLLFVSQTPGFTVELANLLIGNILWISQHDLQVLLALDFLVVATVLILHQKFLAICFDEDQARLQGIHVGRLYLLLLTLIAITVVLLMQVVGVILVMTMLTLPATIANLFTKKLSSMMLYSILLSALFSIVGTFLAFHLNLPVGATIAMLAGITYVIGLLTVRK